MAAKIHKLLFIDTNIWLDFYRTRNDADAGLTLLKHVEGVADRIIVTYQLESEFKKNRQAAILEGMQELKAPPQISRPGLLSDAKASQILKKSIKEAEKQVKKLKARLIRALANPAAHDPVYQACQRIFHKEDWLVLKREDRLRHIIRRGGLRRFLHGCPPRKKSDTSIGDAFNWEWIIHCAIEKSNAEIVIVSRDSDYGVTFDNKSYMNDHLRQEFSERVSQKRKVLLYARLSDALKYFAVPISKEEAEVETELIEGRLVFFESTCQTPGCQSYQKPVYAQYRRDEIASVLQKLERDELQFYCSLCDGWWKPTPREKAELASLLRAAH